MSPSFRGNRTEDPLEARATPRVGADLPVELRSRAFSGPLPGRTRDLSIAGACIATASPFDIKSVDQVAIMTSEGEPLVLRCDGCWQREEPSAQLMLTGLSFGTPNEGQLDRIWDIVLDSGKYLARFLCEKTELHELGLEDAMSLSQMTRYKDIPCGHTLYRQDTDEPGRDSIFLVIEGAVTLQVRVGESREVEFARLESGQFFGGLPILAGVPHAESAVAATDVRLLEIDRQSFQYIRTARPWLGYRLGSAMLRISTQRLRQIVVRVREML
ncbi:MAG: cyclic nucleotide-binding domain-containing protein [bacterium]|nr:cyclic nucleotide-binding domain-containing protein [bacterium]